MKQRRAPIPARTHRPNRAEAGVITFSDRRQGMIFLAAATIGIPVAWIILLVI
jgi:hypothetical protein